MIVHDATKIGKQAQERTDNLQNRLTICKMSVDFPFSYKKFPAFSGLSGPVVATPFSYSGSSETTSQPNLPMSFWIFGLASITSFASASMARSRLLE